MFGGGVSSLLNFFFQKCSWGSETHAQFFFWGGRVLGCLGRPTLPPGGRAGSENDTLLPMTMTCNRFKFWSGPAWRSKVIIRKPWRRKNKKIKKEKKFWQNHKAFPAGSRECLITYYHIPAAKHTLQIYQPKYRNNIHSCIDIVNT